MNSRSKANCDWLILVPTKTERDQLDFSMLHSTAIEICGFGPIIAAARTAVLAESIQPKRILLVGIAGHLSNELKIGDAYKFRSVSCYGIGIGRDATYTAAAAAGWPQYEENQTLISETLQLEDHQNAQSGGYGDLLTVFGASATAAEAQQLRKRFPDSGAEDMEGFGVAAAAKLANIPLTIVRGISNEAGIRDKNEWKIKQALEAANELAINVIRDSQ